MAWYEWNEVRMKEKHQVLSEFDSCKLNWRSKTFELKSTSFFPFDIDLKKFRNVCEIYLHIRLVIRLYWKGWPFMMMNAQRWRPRGVLRQCIDFELTFPYCLHVTLRNEFFWLSLKTTCKISSLEWFSINFCILPSLFFSRVNFSL